MRASLALALANALRSFEIRTRSETCALSGGSPSQRSSTSWAGETAMAISNITSAFNAFLRPQSSSRRHSILSLQGHRSLGEAVNGRTVLITGTSSGIGRAAAIKVAAAGGEVLLVARRGEQLET